MQHRTAILYFAAQPQDTRENILRVRDAVAEMVGVDLFIAGYRLDKTTDTHFEGVPFIQMDQQDMVSLNYPAKGYGQKSDQRQFRLIPGNCDMVPLYFMRHYPDYDQMIVMEDDVVYSGRYHDLFQAVVALNGDLLCAHVSDYFKDWTHASQFNKGHYGQTEPEKLVFLPFHKISYSLLRALDHAYLQGLSGHHEMTIPYVAAQEGMAVVDIGGTGPYVTPEFKNRFYIGRLGPDQMKRGSFRATPAMLRAGAHADCLYHPVKPWPLWLKSQKKRFLSIVRYYWEKLQLFQ